METGYGRGSVKFIRVQECNLRLDRMVALAPAANNQTKPNHRVLLGPPKGEPLYVMVPGEISVSDQPFPILQCYRHPSLTKLGRLMNLAILGILAIFLKTN